MNKSPNLPPNFINYSQEDQKLALQYITSLSVTEYKAYNIAMNHLGTSFNILKSNGFIKWKKTQL